MNIKEIEAAGYIIKMDGTVLNKLGYPMVGGKDKKGYNRISLTVNSIQITAKRHRLVACKFIPNINNKPQVNHKDGNKLNNHVSNLEWCTNSENQTHALKTGLKTITNFQNAAWDKTTKLVLDTNTGIFYKGSKEAANVYGLNRNTLRAKLNGIQKNNTPLILC